MMLSMVGGPVRKQIPEMGTKMVLIQKPTEFGECSKWASLFRKTISCIDHLIHSQYFMEIGRMARSILNSDLENEKGCRSIASSQVSEWMERNWEPIDVVMETTFDKPALTKPGTTVLL